MRMRDLCSLLSLLLVSGCGVRGVTGGTPGVFRAGGEPLSEIQITVHEASSSGPRSIGFGVTAVDGAFELATPGAQGPLRLGPGEYVFTLESAGAPVKIPQEFLRAETSPLKVRWSTDQKSLDLQAPAAFPKQ
jgi:hypothetical protein